MGTGNYDLLSYFMVENVAPENFVVRHKVVWIFRLLQ